MKLRLQENYLRLRLTRSEEKDFRCLTRTQEEQEPDAYPHPAEC